MKYIKLFTGTRRLGSMGSTTTNGDSIVKGIIDDIINTAVKTAEVDEQKTTYLQHFINKHNTIVSN
jgi:hypothetical protein